ncbi:MAG: sugar transferase [Bacteroidia bacterium]|nr:sugar transferase [Bacteroidia bacterium]
MYLPLKRLLDILISILAMVLFIPFFIPIAIGLKLTGEGYIFYTQDRIGYKNRKFRIWKFATMLLASPGLGSGSITLKNDWRLTPMGGFLRKTKINEVPQVINVLIGDMSVVGPRPQMEADFLKYPAAVQARVYNVKPGITSLGAIIFRDEEKYFHSGIADPHEFYKNVISPYKGHLELWYQENISLKTDFLIVFLTAWVVLFPKSALPFRMFKGLPEMPKELK